MTETSILQILIVLRPEAIRSLFLWHLFCDTGKVTGSGVCLSKWAFSVRGKWTDSAELLEKISGGDCLLPVGQGLKNDAKTMAILRSNPKQGISSLEATVWFSHYSVRSKFLLLEIGQNIFFSSWSFFKNLALSLNWCRISCTLTAPLISREISLYRYWERKNWKLRWRWYSEMRG